MSRYKILVVDDEPRNLQLLRQILKDDYDLAFAKSGEDALKNVETSLPDLILCDVMMPGLSGYDVCQRLKADPRTAHIPLVFVSAMGEEADEIKGIDAGASDYLVKPVRPAMVRLKARVHLMVAEQRRQLEAQYGDRIRELEAEVQSLRSQLA